MSAVNMPLYKIEVDCGLLEPVIVDEIEATDEDDAYQKAISKLLNIFIDKERK